MFWSILFAVVMLFGHLAVWVALFNRLHATALPRRIIKILEKLIYVSVVAVPIGLAWRAGGDGLARIADPSRLMGSPARAAYVALCLAWASWVTVAWCVRRATRRTPAVLLQNHSRMTNLAAELPVVPLRGRLTRLAASLPGNELLRIEVNEKQIVLPRLDPALDGLAIAHLSDLHFAGNLTRGYFDHLVDQVNGFQADLIAITGDIVDKPECLPWIGETLERLRSGGGKLFVLGNHDTRIKDERMLRASLRAAGFVDVGRQWHSVSIRGRRLLVAGNELPWYGPPTEIPLSESAENSATQTAGGESAGHSLRLLLAHSPDQFLWARDRDFDLMLCGHTHGGQIRLPVIGAVVLPSYHGVKYDCGVFHEPPTVMHLSRGSSSLHALRWNCPPEVTRLVLRAPR